MFLPAINASQYINTGRLRGIAVTSRDRLAAFPDLPTISASGLPGYESSQWYGLLAPAGTPNDVLNLLNAQIKKIMQTPEMQEKMKADGLIPVGGSREQFTAHIKSDMAKWSKVITSSGATVD